MWLVLLVGGGRGGDAAEVAVFESVAVAFEGDDFGVVDEPVDHCGGDHVVAEDFTPAMWGWHMFVMAYLACCLRKLCLGVSD